MYQNTVFNIPDKKLLVAVHVTSNPGVYIWKIFFREGKFSDIVRKKVKQSTPDTKGSFTLIGYEVIAGLTDVSLGHTVSVRVIWEISPQWWSDHPEWHKAPFCGEVVPEEGWFAKKSTVPAICDIEVPAWK